MKKYLLYGIIVVLLMVIASGGTYIFISDRNNNTNNENKVNESDNSNKNQDNNKEQLTLSKEELGEYLSYVPFDYSGKSAYDYEKITVNDIEQKYLLNMALGKTLKNNKYYFEKKSDDERIATLFYYENETSGTYYFMEKEKLNPILNTMYNKVYNFSDLTDSLEDYVADFGGVCFIYFDNGFSYTDCAGSPIVMINNIEKYETNADNLIIYTESAVKNLHTEHIEEFTKYKHIFKKNDTGYYWYSTEVA